MTQTPNFSEQHTYYDGTEFLVSVEKKQKKKNYFLLISFPWKNNKSKTKQNLKIPPFEQCYLKLQMITRDARLWCTGLSTHSTNDLESSPITMLLGS